MELGNDLESLRISQAVLSIRVGDDDDEEVARGCRTGTIRHISDSVPPAETFSNNDEPVSVVSDESGYHEKSEKSSLENEDVSDQELQITSL